MHAWQLNSMQDCFWHAETSTYWVRLPTCASRFPVLESRHESKPIHQSRANHMQNIQDVSKQCKTMLKLYIPVELISPQGRPSPQVPAACKMSPPRAPPAWAISRCCMCPIMTTLNKKPNVLMFLAFMTGSHVSVSDSAVLVWQLYLPLMR